MNKLLVYTVALVSTFFTGVSNANVEFFALTLPSLIQKELIRTQRKIAQTVKTPYYFSPAAAQNLHITLKEIGNINSREEYSLKQHFKKYAKHYLAFTIYNLLDGSFLRVNNDGLVLLLLKPSKRLTDLAFFIDNNLLHLYRQKKLSGYSRRMDFPHYGHITLGKIISKTNKINTKLINNQLKNIHTQAGKLTVNKYTLLESNAPRTPRIYTPKEQFYLN